MIDSIGDVVSIAVNFKPPSIDTTKPATIEISKNSDNTKVLAEYPSEQVRLDLNPRQVFLNTSDCFYYY